MSRGKAHGRNRQYQIECRDVLMFQHPGLTPYHGDGVDVEFECGGTTWSIDVALCNPAGDVLVAECRRRADAVKQGDLAEFAWKVELLRKALNAPIAGVFFAKSQHQLGAVRAGDFAAITMAVLAEGGGPPGFAISYHRYDRERERRYKDMVIHIPPDQYQVSGSPDTELKLIRKRPPPPKGEW
jgi:hypothetical protein